ncbi:hypothetical protein JR782_005202 [Salmonella enterica subsp. enterica serovar Eastbourne]|nr:hypothetical protein [Salmonella enterica subsp. enterica serovar Eastbourne]EHC5910680.1 hypothetical protein [Salmonella enterica subsp. enterica serovar Eastbourne]
MKRYFIKYEYGFALLLAVYWSLYFINDKFLPEWPVVNMQGLRVQILAVTVSVFITLFFFFCYDTRERREVTQVFIIVMLSLHILHFLLPALYFWYEWRWNSDVLLVWQFMAFTFGLPLVPMMAFIIPEPD